MMEDEVERGSVTVFCDLALPNAELEQLRAILAARIVQALYVQNLTVRKAQCPSTIMLSRGNQL